MSQKIVKQLSKLRHGAISQSPTQPNIEVSGRQGEVYSNTMRNFIYESQHDKSVLKLVIIKSMLSIIMTKDVYYVSFLWTGSPSQ